MRHAVRRSFALALTGSLLLAGCSGQDEPDPDASASPSAEASDYLEVPDGVELTEQGADLDLGDTATVAFQPRQDVVGVLDLSVTRVEKGDIRDLAAYKLDAKTRKSTPYYVRITAKNTGEEGLAGARLPLYLADGENHLLSSSPFKSSFKPCPSTPLPAKFPAGATYSGCLVYLVPASGSFAGLSFYPIDGFDPITWTGDVSKPEPRKAKAPAKNKQDRKKR